MKKITSITKKIYNIDLAAYKEGKRNYKTVNAYAEVQAKKRAKICDACDRNEVEPIAELSIPDDRIPVLSNRYCEVCGCSLPYKVRQSIQKCPLKKW